MDPDEQENGVPIIRVLGEADMIEEIVEEIVLEENDESSYYEEIIEDASEGPVQFKDHPNQYFPPHSSSTNEKESKKYDDEFDKYAEATISKIIAEKEPKKGDDDNFSKYAEATIAKIIADDTKKIEISKKVSGSLAEYEEFYKLPKKFMANDDYSFPMDEPPRIFPVAPIKNRPRKPREPSSADSDPPATLLIQSFQTQTTPFASMDEMSDISPILYGCDDNDNEKDKNNNSAKNGNADIGDKEALAPLERRILLVDTKHYPAPTVSGESTSGTEQTGNMDPEIGGKERESEDSSGRQEVKKRCLSCKYSVLVIFLGTFVLCALGYLVFYILDYVKTGSNQTVIIDGNHSGGSGPVTDFVGTMKTTPMDPFVEGCRFDNYTQPHVRAQCTCNSEIDILTDDVREKYFALNMLFISLDISNVWELPEKSCDTRNQAMVWLATTYSKDRTDLTQKYVLASLFLQMTGEQWGIQDGWLENGDVCTWSGVRCNAAGLVTSIYLDGNGLKGSMSDELSLLNSLENLSLGNNGITGTIPEGLFANTNLKELSLSMNSITGLVPETVGLATNLEVLRVDMNRMVGGLSAALGQATSLRKLSLGYNNFEGNIPPEFFQLVNLDELSLEANTGVTGGLVGLGSLTSLTQLSLSSTSIKSRIPSEIESLTNLRVLKMANSFMSGDIPVEVAQLTNLNHLDLSNSNFRRALPSFLGQLPSLTYLSLHSNHFSGTLSTELANLSNLVHLSLHDNLIFGEIPQALGRLTLLDTLTLQGNQLTGRAPNDVCMLRRQELIVFSTDCSDGSQGVLCPVPNCCTSCQ